tara:strand:- start:1571 stop:1894 length:324 start_codon:yes stop_codon:yes gene_type:complete
MELIMEKRNYGPSGALFNNVNKKMDKHPDFTGTLELSQEVVEYLSDQFHAGVPFPKITLAGWRKTIQKSGNNFVSLKAGVPQDRQAKENVERKVAQDSGGEKDPWDM